MSRRGRGLLLAAAIAAALLAGFVSVRRASEQLAVLDACDAAAEGRFADALAGTEGRVGASETGRVAAECRCHALLALGDADACAELLREVVAHAEGWAPSPPLAAHLVNTSREAGRTREAAELARLAGRRHPADPDLFYLELLTRAAVEDEAALLRELSSRVPERGPSAARMRVSLANRHLLRGDARAAAAALGAAPPPDAGDAAPRWFELRGMALASAGNLAGLEQTYASWHAAGGDPTELRARLALTLSIAGLRLPDRTPLELLQEVLARPLADPALEEALTIRLVLTLVNAGRTDEALAVYDAAAARFALEGLARGELERAALHRELGTGAGRRAGELHFTVSPPLEASRLLVSPSPAAPPDAPYERFALPGSGRVVVERELHPAPVRWLLRDAQGRTRASGAASLRVGAPTRVAVTPRPPVERPRVALVQPPGDGRRRVAALLLDCADWPIIRYLQERGELPVLDQLLARGQRAVLVSDPPLTAAALEALVWPERSGPPTFVGLLHRFGVELAGLSSVGENPLGALDWLLPPSRDLFSVLGEGPHAAANLLFAHGGIRSGRHAVVTGPQGRERRVPLATSARDLDADERRRFPALARVTRERDAVHLRTIAAELDVAEQLLREGEVDLLALRVEPLDILTHAHFAEVAREAQDDGRGLLFAVYRYLDARLADVHAALDADDVLVVFSDHGILTAMEHSRHAFFVAAGGGIPHGRAPGTPEFRGVSRTLADLLGVETGWPDGGLAFAPAPPSPSLARSAAAPHPARAER
ncbi:MAG: alkaline phosphatase family protein [Myxococcota bacterium]|nr:alkaline phosphatase family protein [Myxococcota bacterium]